MKLADFFAPIERYGTNVLRCNLVALDAKSGVVVFDTRRVRIEKLKRYHEYEVTALWADVEIVRRFAYGDYAKPILKCFVMKPEENEKRPEITVNDCSECQFFSSSPENDRVCDSCTDDTPHWTKMGEITEDNNG